MENSWTAKGIVFAASLLAILGIGPGAMHVDWPVTCLCAHLSKETSV